VHDTPESALIVAPEGFGVLCAAQLLPFQARAIVWLLVELMFDEPTAVQALSARHDTPDRLL
jgi:hypothetical protein